MSNGIRSISNILVLFSKQTPWEGTWYENEDKTFSGVRKSYCRYAMCAIFKWNNFG